MSKSTRVSIELQPVSIPKTRSASIQYKPSLSSNSDSNDQHKRNSTYIGEDLIEGLESIFQTELQAGETCCHNYWCKAKRSYASDFCLFLCFLAVLVLYAMQYRNGTQGYYMSSSIEDTIFAQEMPFTKSHIPKTFHDVQDEGELWDYYSQVLLPALYPTTCGDHQQKTCLPTINGVNFVIQPLRIFQSRMAEQECVIPNHVTIGYDASVVDNIKQNPCYPEYVDGTTSVSQYFNRTRLLYKDDENENLVRCFTFKSRRVGYPVNGDIPTFSYPTSGYECRMPKNANLTQAQKFLHKLQNSNWIDDGTRLVSIDFTVYNPSVGLFAVVRVVFEKSAFGVLVPWRDIIILDIDQSNKTDFNTNYAVLITLFLFVVYYYVQLITEYIAHGKKCW
jgi:hypothetical protein